MRAHLACLVVAAVILSACRASAPAILRFAPPGTDFTRLRNEYALTTAERLALTPDTLRALTQDQVDQIYVRLTTGPIPDGPFRGDLFFPRDRSGRAPLRDLADPVPGFLAHVAALPVERLGRALWRGKVFFRAQGILRNRIEDLDVLRPVITDPDTIPRLTFDGQSTWLLFPAPVSCGKSLLDPQRPSIVIDYARAPEIEGYRRVPDAIAGPEGLNIRDEIRLVRPGLYLGRAYFGPRFVLNFTLVDPSSATRTDDTLEIPPDCEAPPATGSPG